MLEPLHIMIGLPCFEDIVWVFWGVGWVSGEGGVFSDHKKCCNYNNVFNYSLVYNLPNIHTILNTRSQQTAEHVQC